MPDIAWMAWTTETAIFFACIAAALLSLTVLALVRPEAERVGVLGIPTTRGDRLFLSLLGSAFVHLAWIGFVGDPLWAASVVSLVYAAGVFRFV